ncbi:hypothetical protein TNCV_1837771 [Trichonephila clavipes]|nr:hypothetical protein TNCV_1837771 [Trichonephila clavipes]
MLSTYRFAKNAPLMKTKGVWLSKEVTPQTINPGHGTCVVGNRESRIGTMRWASKYTSSMIVRTQLDAGLDTKDYMSQVNIIIT